jgi:2-(1,2-epoxy-1,2-dihydrophenyl)acetyl-CoA isomerase
VQQKNVRCVRRGAVAWVTLDRADAGNAMSLELLADLGEAIRHVEADPRVRALVLTGSGRFFCVGGALDTMHDADEIGQRIRAMTFHLHAVISSLARMPAPTIAAVNGPAAGAGLSLAIACDFVVAVETARFSSSYAAAGLSTDGGQSWTLPRRIGHGRAREMLLLDRRLTAAEALDWGLVNVVAKAGELDQAVTDVAEKLARGPTAAFGRIKGLLADADTAGLEAQLDREARAMAASVATEDAREGIAAFLEKRAPNFRGS